MKNNYSGALLEHEPSRSTKLAITLLLLGSIFAPGKTDAAATRNCEVRFVVNGDTSEFIWGHIIQARKSDDRIYLVDYQLHTVHVVSANGEYLRSYAREGDGPGEVRHPTAVVFGNDGEIGVCKQMPGKIEWFKPDGTYLRTQDPYPTDVEVVPMLIRAEFLDGNLVCQTLRQRFSRVLVDENCLSIVGADESSTLMCTEGERDYDAWSESTSYQLPKSCWDVGPDGSIAWARDRDSGEIVVRKGTQEHIISTGFVGRRRTDTEVEAVRRGIAGAGVRGSVDVMTSAPAISRLHYSDDGALYVRPTSQELTDNSAFGLYHVYSADDPVQEVVYAGPHTSIEGNGYPFPDGSFLMIAERPSTGEAPLGFGDASNLVYYELAEDLR